MRSEELKLKNGSLRRWTCRNLSWSVGSRSCSTLLSSSGSWPSGMCSDWGSFGPVRSTGMSLRSRLPWVHGNSTNHMNCRNFSRNRRTRESLWGSDSPPGK